MAGEKKSKMSAINIFFIFFIVSSILYGAATGRLKEVTDASFASAKGSVTLAINLIGIMALWLGFVRILEAGGLMYSLANLVRPLVKKIFPDVPAGHRGYHDDADHHDAPHPQKIIPCATAQ